MTAIPAEPSAPQNVTFEEHVIRNHPAEPLAPLAGHVVVVFERIGAGEEFRFELQDGQGPPKRSTPWDRFFGKQPEYSAYAVTTEQQRTTRVPATITMDTDLHALKLAIDIVYRVGEPRRVAERRLQDPIGKIRDEAARLIVPEFARTDWEKIRADFRGVEKAVVFTVLGRVQRFASDYGIFVTEVSMNPARNEKRLTVAEDEALEDDLVYQRDKRRAANERETQATDFENHGLKVKADNALRYDSIVDATARTLVKAIEQAGTAIHSPKDLAVAVGTIRDAIEALRDVSNGAGAQTSLPVLTSKAALAAGQTGAAIVIAELLGETEGMSWPSREIKKKLQGATLHLVAELLMPDATDVTVTDYRERLSDARTEIASHPDQHAYFDRFIDSDRLRRRLN